MSLKVAQNDIFTPLQKLPKNVGDLCKLMLPKALKSCPKSNKSPNRVTLKASLIEAFPKTMRNMLHPPNL